MGNGTDAERSRGVATCAAIRSALGADIVVSSGPEYVAGASGAWNLFNTQSSPTCIVLPSSTSHVQVAMRAIFQNKIRFAVQAGGHSAMEGWNTYGASLISV
jgi:FAD/FMN-containing dehydrogenase